MTARAPSLRMEHQAGADAAPPPQRLQQRLREYAHRAASGIPGEGYTAAHVAAACGDGEAVGALLGAAGLERPACG